ncbi:uncharacterized protein LOC132066869 [Lycium ferocissimum]|uniref:uncharacterized protein LOC132066869 n=1 Tax=Lycium ferocissimum TaxID=112874 RepID=UPI00281638BE|nr:uncharacterized protein LOC132066869 [Lycium ferocissimum]
MGAERRSKNIHDPRRIPNPPIAKSSKKIDAATVTKRKKTTDVVPASKGKQVVEAEAEEDQLPVKKQDPKFLVKFPPTHPIRYASYMNHNIKKDLEDKLTERQQQLFSKTIFGKYLQMQHCEVQGQLFRCLMVRELKKSTPDAFVIDINGTELTFSLFEFALMSGLKCYGEEIVFNEGKNGLLEKYFGGSKKSVKKMELNECFNDKNWGVDDDADQDALKIAVLYFIHNYILSGEKRNVVIPRLHFDLVDSGRYKDYTWGKEAFVDLIKSIHNKMDKPKQYYCLRGFPFAIQAWLYECCSNVDPDLAVRNGDRIPRILNWKTVDPTPSFNHLMTGMFKDDVSEVYAELKDLRKAMDAKFDKVFDLIKGHQTSEKV